MSISNPSGLAFVPTQNANYDQFVLEGAKEDGTVQALDSFKSFCSNEQGTLFHRGGDVYDCIIRKPKPDQHEKTSTVLMWVLGILVILLVVAILGFLLGQQIKACRAKRTVRGADQRADPENGHIGTANVM